MVAPRYERGPEAGPVSGAGGTALVLPVPEVEHVVSTWREQFDPSAGQGMPAHITVLVPFLALERIGASELAALRRLFACMGAVAVEFPRIGSFADVLYLDPVPPAPFVELTSRVARRWPEAPPYGGTFDDVVPHLTLAHGGDEALADRIREDVGPALPLKTVLYEARLAAFKAGRWSSVASFSLD